MSKRIVLCCDGTGQRFQENKSNPLRLHYCLDNHTNDFGAPEQISFYDPGVGTFDPEGGGETEGLLGGIFSSISEKVVGGTLGYGIERNITDAYRFLMQTYEVGDSIFLFWLFERGFHRYRRSRTCCEVWHTWCAQRELDTIRNGYISTKR